MKMMIIGLVMMTAFLTPDRKIHDLAEVTPGQTVTDTIRFRNTGDSTLVIYNISPDCNCTTADYTKKPLQPGEEGYIAVRYKAPQNGRGRFRHSLRIRSNAENSREIVYLNGTISEK